MRRLKRVLHILYLSIVTVDMSRTLSIDPDDCTNRTIDGEFKYEEFVKTCNESFYM